MAKVKIQGHASGTGVITLTAPNTSTDRTITLPDGTDTLATKTQVTTAGGRKNLIINGGMDVWQRGTSFSHTNGKIYTADRFWLNPQSNASTYSRQAVTSPIAGMPSQYCLRLQRNSGGSSTGLTYFSTDLESSNAFACRGRKLTLSFYARKGADYSATNDAFALGIVSGKGTDQTLVSGYTSGAYVANQSNTLTSSWQRFSVTTSSVIADDITQIGLQGTRSSTGTAGANDYMEITGIQLEINDEVTDFEYRSYGEELTLCKRYYHYYYGNSAMHPGRTISSNRLDIAYHFPVELRTDPTLEATDIGQVYVADQSAFNPSNPTIAAVHISTDGLVIRRTCSETVGANKVCTGQILYLRISAEL